METNNQKFLSTTAISTILKKDREEIFKILENEKWIARDKKENIWILTKIGMKNGGEYKISYKDKNKKYIVWPDCIINDEIFIKKSNSKVAMLTATKIAVHFDISPSQLNLIFSELGWIEKHPVEGWSVKKLGINNGGEELSVKDTGIPYVVWPDFIVKNDILIKNIKLLKDTDIKNLENENNDNVIHNSKNKLDYIDDFRKLHPAIYRTMDGHYVRSKAEMIIDNWLYMNEIAHAYERKVPVEESLCTDFFILKNKVYIEYWGLENNPKYIENKKRKLLIYEKYGINLIELDDSDIALLDDKLANKLLKFNIQAY